MDLAGLGCREAEGPGGGGLQVLSFSSLTTAGRWELSGTGWASTYGSGSSQLRGKAKAEVGDAGASLGCERTRGYHSQTSLPVPRRIWGTSMCAVSQVIEAFG